MCDINPSKLISRALLLVSLFILLILSSDLYTTELIGHVYDAVTGKGLPFANIVVEATHLGTSADTTGFYTLELPKPGRYWVSASVIGYRPKRYRVNIKDDKPIKLDFYLEPTIIQLPTHIEVIGKRPMIEKSFTGSQRVMDTRVLEGLTTRDIRTAITTRAGVSGEGTDIHIRGGRSNEILMVIDGIPIRDVLSGSAFGIHIPTTSVSEVQVLTGGFNAEYGAAMSGIVELKLKEGTDTYRGDIYLTSSKPFTPYNEHSFTFRLQGPEYLTTHILSLLNFHVPGKVRFFTNLYVKFSDTYLPHTSRLYSSVFNTAKLSPREENVWSAVFKLTWNVTPNQKFSLTFSKSIEINQGYFLSRADYPFAYGFPYRYIQMLDHYPVFTRDGNQLSLSYRNAMSKSTFFELKLARFFTNLHLDVAGKHWSEYDELLDIYPRYDTIIAVGDGFWDIGDAPYWHDHYVETYINKGDLTHVVNPIWQLKTGYLVKLHEIQWIDIHYPWFDTPDGLGLNHDIYRAKTIDGGIYLQTRISFAGMIANLGIRVDFWVPGKYLENGVQNTLTNPDIHPIIRQEYERYLNTNPTVPFTEYHFKLHLSPRIGISYPVTDRDKFFFSYGHFSQLPDMKFVYSKLGRRATSTYELVGNPNLNPIVTVAYELGIEHLFTPYTKIMLTAYYKDIFNYPTATKVPGEPPNPDFWMYFNSDYARSLGLELTLKKRLSSHYYADVELTISQSKGRASTAEDIYWKGEEESLKEWYLRWDRPIKFFTTIGYVLSEGEPLNLFGVTIRGYLAAALSISLQSGRRYTPIDTLGNPMGEKNSGLGPYWSRVDLKLKKGIKLGALKFNLIVEARNIFNHRNVYYINPVTGRAYEPGDPLPYWQQPEAMLNPARYREGRNIKLGIELKW